MSKRKRIEASDEDGEGGDRKKSRQEVQVRSSSWIPTAQEDLADEDQKGANKNDNPPRASLLGLPGELRNRIVHFAIVNGYEEYDEDSDEDWCPEDIFVSKRGQYEQPGLLSCCRQLRDEAKPIFLAENSFYIAIFDGKLAPGPDHWVWSKNILESFRHLQCFQRGRISWRNIMEWLKLYHQGKVPPMLRYNCNGFSTDLTACSEAFTMVRVMEGNSWDVIEKALAAFKRGIDAITRGSGSEIED